MLFVKTQVVERVLQKSSHLAAKRKQRLKNKLEGSKRQRKKRKQKARTIAKEAESRGILRAPNSRDNKLKSKLQLMYNLV